MEHLKGLFENSPPSTPVQWLIPQYVYGHGMAKQQCLGGGLGRGEVIATLP